MAMPASDVFSANRPGIRAEILSQYHVPVVTRVEVVKTSSGEVLVADGAPLFVGINGKYLHVGCTRLSMAAVQKLHGMYASYLSENNVIVLQDGTR